ncbi:MAG: DUF2225 domain-containing protein [Clostridia bacterium]|nr:DUF2225 domain-containing protein [Clostridia bacterium]
MTTFRPKTQKCYICGKESRHRVLTSTNSFGSPDLDLRPPEMQRSTMPYWVTVCPSCGYAARDLSDETGVSEDWLKSESYLTCDGIPFESHLAINFYRHYLICMQDRKTEDAFFALLHAAWSCDDVHHTERAVKCREMAIPLIEQLIETDNEHKNYFLLIKADLLRRSGQFDRLAEEYSSVRFDDDKDNRILAFQLEKAKENDTGCYRIADTNPKN